VFKHAISSNPPGADIDALVLNGFGVIVCLAAGTAQFRANSRNRCSIEKKFPKFGESSQAGGAEGPL
jgi:hypothetical protein